MTRPERIILASNSPRRRELLTSLGLQFQVLAPQVDEKAICDPSLPPEAYVESLASAKGESISRHHPDALVISADTVVVLNGQFLEKPANQADARRMLDALQGTTHQVATAIGVFYQDRQLVRAKITTVRIASLSADEIAAYVETGEPMDKAGAYAIQGIGGQFVESIDGCYSNVVGLSLPLLKTLLSELGINLLTDYRLQTS